MYARTMDKRQFSILPNDIANLYTTIMKELGVSISSYSKILL